MRTKVCILRMQLYRAIVGPLYALSLALPRLKTFQRLGDYAAKVIRRLAKLMVPNPLFIRGHFLYYPPHIHYLLPPLALGVFERETVFLLERILSPGMTFVDVGAHIGYFSLLAARSGCKVYAFEPDPINFDCLLKNCRENGYAAQVLALPKGVSDHCGRERLYLGNLDSAQSSLFKHPFANQDFVDIEVLSLDTFFESIGWPPVHVVKMDIEGGEVPALRGMRDLVLRNQGLKLIIEFLPGLEVSGFSPADYFATLIDLGFMRFSTIEKSPKILDIPGDIPFLLKYAPGGINLLCEREVVGRG